MSVADAVATAITFTWLGMVVAISFVEAPLKFRAPGVSLQIGLGIGRLVFRALNTIEAVLAVALLAAIAADPPITTTTVAIGAVVAALTVQVLAVRPWLARRSNAVLAAPAAPTGSVDPSRRSRAHYGYVGLELVKGAGLVTAGATLLAG